VVTKAERMSARHNEAASHPRDHDEALLMLARIVDEVQDPQLRGRLVAAIEEVEHQRVQGFRQLAAALAEKDRLHERQLDHHKKRGDRGEALQKHLENHVDGVLGRARKRWLNLEPEPDHDKLAKDAVDRRIAAAFGGM
jgi:hypothetical protein